MRRPGLLIRMLPAALLVAALAATAMPADGPGPPVAAPTPTTPAHRGIAGPARDRASGPMGLEGSTMFTSRNWAGYIGYLSSHGTDFKAVKATWTQPTVTCEKANAWTVFWVGLDGWWNDTVEQGGTSAQCVNGTPHYQTWWEMFPTNAIQTVFSINPGDTMTAGVTFQPATSTFVITVRDTTSGNSFTRREQCGSGIACDRSSADVVAEDVGHFPGSGYFPLADYQTTSFGSASITDSGGHAGSFTDAAWLRAAVTEQSSGVTYATASPLAKAGTSFRATWKHA